MAAGYRCRGDCCSFWCPRRHRLRGCRKVVRRQRPPTTTRRSSWPPRVSWAELAVLRAGPRLDWVRAAPAGRAARVTVWAARLAGPLTRSGPAGTAAAGIASGPLGAGPAPDPDNVGVGSVAPAVLFEVFGTGSNPSWGAPSTSSGLAAACSSRRSHGVLPRRACCAAPWLRRWRPIRRRRARRACPARGRRRRRGPTVRVAVHGRRDQRGYVVADAAPSPRRRP